MAEPSKVDEPHKHNFNGKGTQKVGIYDYGESKKNPVKVGHDILKVRVCKCGVKQTYDLEREL